MKPLEWELFPGHDWYGARNSEVLMNAWGREAEKIIKAMMDMYDSFRAVTVETKVAFINSKFRDGLSSVQQSKSSSRT